jgi:hypothetical protein
MAGPDPTLSSQSLAILLSLGTEPRGFPRFGGWQTPAGAPEGWGRRLALHGGVESWLVWCAAWCGGGVTPAAAAARSVLGPGRERILPAVDAWEPMGA